MDGSNEKVVGILGGMGPEATIDLFDKIVRATHAKKDEDHLRIIVDCNPKMPSRLDAILKGGPSPVPAMQETARNLERAGAEIIIIGANTAHYFHDDVQAAVRVPVLNMIEETARATRERWPDIRKVGILATTGTVKTRLYHKEYAKLGIDVIEPSTEDQESVMKSIFSFKYGGDIAEDRRRLLDVAEHLVEAGAQAILMGCTEIPVILKGVSFKVPLVDANEIVAEVVVRQAKGIC